MYPHYFSWSFEWSILEILKWTGTFEIPARFRQIWAVEKIKFLEIESRQLKSCLNIIRDILEHV